MSSFLIPEFESYDINIDCDQFNDIIKVESGINKTIIKEEWRDDFIANVFYPIDKPKSKVIIHFQGGVPLLQDQRSIMLANKGYFVVEVAYNVQKYGQTSMWLGPEYKMEYTEGIIKRALAHDRTKGDTVCVIGHSKGAEFAIVAGNTFHKMVDLTISSGNHLIAMINNYTYRNKQLVEPITTYRSFGYHPEGLVERKRGLTRVNRA